MVRLIRGIMFSCLIALAAVGCDVVTVESPLGVPLTEAEMKPLQGTWRIVDEKTEAPGEMMPGPDGKVVLGSLKWNEEKGAFEAINEVAMIRKVGKFTVGFAQLDPEKSEKKAESPKESDGYGFSLCEMPTNDQIRIAIPNTKTFAKAVETKKLRGAVARSKVSLKCNADELNSFIEETGVEKCFETKTAIVMERVSKK